MKVMGLSLVVMAVLALAVVLPAQAQIVYTQVNISIPVGESYNIDLNGDGVIDFTLKSKFLQGYCVNGDEFVWSLTVIPANGDDVMTMAGQIGSDYAAALPYGTPVNSGQSFNPNDAILSELYWGACGIGTLGEWLNLPDRYLGLQFRAPDGTTHYAWAKLSTVAYVDERGHLHASTLLSGFAYQTSPDVGIAAGAIR